MMKNKTIFVSAVLAVVGVILQLVGAFAFCAATEVGFNLKALTNPVVLVGVAAIVAATVLSLAMKIRSAAKREGNVELTLALEIALTGVLFSVLFLVLFAAYPVLMNW